MKNRLTIKDLNFFTERAAYELQFSMLEKRLIRTKSVLDRVQELRYQIGVAEEFIFQANRYIKKASK